VKRLGLHLVMQKNICNIVNYILSRPSNERPFLILVVGYPDKEAVIPKIGKKSLKDIMKFV